MKDDLNDVEWLLLLPDELLMLRLNASSIDRHMVLIYAKLCRKGDERFTQIDWQTAQIIRDFHPFIKEIC